MEALLKLIPFRDYLYAALAIAGVAYYNIHVHGLIEADRKHEQAALAVQSAKALADARTQIDDLNKKHAAEVAANEAKHESDLKANSDATAAELQRLRDIAARSSSGRPVVVSATSPSASGDSGDDSLVRLGFVSEELASALRDARTDLGACYADRDSLTGK